jgi:hypothetical protein
MDRREFLAGGLGATILTGLPADLFAQPARPPRPESRDNGHLQHLDFLPDRVVLRFFKWDVKTQSPDAIDRLEPFHTAERPRPS